MNIIIGTAILLVTSIITYYTLKLLVHFIKTYKIGKKILTEQIQVLTIINRSDKTDSEGNHSVNTEIICFMHREQALEAYIRESNKWKGTTAKIELNTTYIQR